MSSSVPKQLAIESRKNFAKEFLSKGRMEELDKLREEGIYIGANTRRPTFTLPRLIDLLHLPQDGWTQLDLKVRSDR